ncbi:MAG: PfkB family carbohydrate kinase [Candidatus Izemoplasma sp.]|nr:PfkB family carbohydrate kinase [Candidatus Izemoplasma sp.]
MIKDVTKPNDILLVGEILIDIITTKNEKKHMFGGSPANITINLKKLGFTPYLCATIGNDDYGKFLNNVLQAENLSLKFIRRSNKPTSIVELNQTKDTPTPTFKRQADKDIILSEKLRNHLKNSKILHFTYWPLNDKPARDTINTLIQIAQDENVLIGFDPNFHSALTTDKENAINTIKDTFKKVDIIKPSLDDSKRIFGPDLTPEAYMEHYESYNIDLIILTLGKDGILVSYRKQRFSFHSMADEVVDATGAGDAFWSGLYGGLLTNHDIKEACIIGSICSAYNLKQVGALTNLPTINTLMNRLKEEQ